MFISDELLVENTLMNCTNLTSLDLARDRHYFDFFASLCATHVKFKVF